MAVRSNGSVGLKCGGDFGNGIVPKVSDRLPSQAPCMPSDMVKYLTGGDRGHQQTAPTIRSSRKKKIFTYDT